MTEKSKKAGLSFGESRRNLLTDLQASAGNKVVERKVRFHNDDVPTFLGRLKEFEQTSRDAVLTIK